MASGGKIEEHLAQVWIGSVSGRCKMDPYAFASVALSGDVITSAGVELGELLKENVVLFLVAGSVCCAVVEAIC